MPDGMKVRTQPWQQWLASISDGATQQEIAEKVGVSRSTVSRWSKREVAGAEMVLQIAAAFGADPVRGLVASGWIDPAMVISVKLNELVSRVPTPILISELYSRFVIDYGRVEKACYRCQ
jgi:transcriptional regulator with XRE-family HTH domain